MAKTLQSPLKRKERTAKPKTQIQGQVDMPFMLLTVLLVVIGLVMLLSASYPTAIYDPQNRTGGDAFYYFKRQAVFALLGFAVMYVVSKLNYRGLQGLALTILLISFVAMLAVKIPGLGYTSGGATRWLKYPIQWQPSELGKVIMIICFAIGSFILNKTYFGRYFYAVGGNVEAAKLSGIRVSRIKYLVFAISGFFAGLAGIVMLSRTASGNASSGADGFEFEVITCVVLGGVSVTGGVGRMSGVVAGTFIIGALKNGMVLMNVNSYVQKIVMGVVLALAVGFDCIQNKKRAN